ncbi:MAG: DUF3299 domain-containing protein [Pseudomonadota bacterium]
MRIDVANHFVWRACLLLLLLLPVVACERPGEPAQSAALADYKEVEWTDLMPEADLQALLNPPQYLNEIEEGSAEDQRMFEQLASGNIGEGLDRYQQALVSKDIRTEFDGKKIRIAGYLVPLEFDSAEVVTQAFVVPYFGACIHVPPPPPNQIILVNAANGLNLNDMYNPYWVSGELSTTLNEMDLATSAYEMQAYDIELYTE